MNQRSIFFSVLFCVIASGLFSTKALALEEGFNLETKRNSDQEVVIRSGHFEGAPDSQNHYTTLTELPPGDFALFLSRVLQHKSMDYRYQPGSLEYRFWPDIKTRLNFENLRFGVFHLYSIGMGFVRIANPKDIADYDWPRMKMRVPSEAWEDALMKRFREDVGADKILLSLKESALWKNLDSRQQRDLKLWIDQIMITKFYHQAPEGTSKEMMKNWISDRMSNLIMALNYDFRNNAEAGTQALVELLQTIRKTDTVAYSALVVEMSQQLKLEDPRILYTTGKINEIDERTATRRTSRYKNGVSLGFMLATVLGFIALDYSFPLWYTYLQNLDGSAFEPRHRWMVFALGVQLTSTLGEWTGEAIAYLRNKRQNLLNREERMASGDSKEADPTLVKGIADILSQQGPRSYKLCKEVLL